MDTAPLQWPAPTVTASHPGAVDRYQAGIAALVADSPHARSLLAEAVDRDPSFALSRAALAAASVVAGEPFAPFGPFGPTTGA
jgi:hypothetical protein